jgi:hypothetical protein
MAQKIGGQRSPHDLIELLAGERTGPGTGAIKS